MNPWEGGWGPTRTIMNVGEPPAGNRNLLGVEVHMAENLATLAGQAGATPVPDVVGEAGRGTDTRVRQNRARRRTQQTARRTEPGGGGPGSGHHREGTHHPLEQ